RLGLSLPLFVVHDIGLLFAAPSDQVDLRPRAAASVVLSPAPEGEGPKPPSPLAALHADYLKIIQEIAESEAAKQARTLRLGDDLVAVILARLLGSLDRERLLASRPSVPVTLPLDTEIARGLD